MPPCAHPRNFKQRWLVTAKLIFIREAHNYISGIFINVK